MRIRFKDQMYCHVTKRSTHCPDIARTSLILYIPYAGSMICDILGWENVGKDEPAEGRALRQELEKLCVALSGKTEF